MDIKRYKHSAEYSYTLGMSLTIELIRHKKSAVRMVYVHPNYAPKDSGFNIIDICAGEGVPCEVNQKIFSRLSDKENVFVIGVFDKYDASIADSVPHVALVNPGDSGNLGTIIRTGLGFGFRDYVIIRPGVDIYDPKTVRSSMGAVFHARFSYYDTFEDYIRLFPTHKLYPFMLNGKTDLKDITKRPDDAFTLIFGNEGSGLPDHFIDYGESVFIKHSGEIDSLNLSIAFGIAASVFAE